MRNNPARQRGIGLLGLLFLLLIAIGLATLVLRLGPAYMEFMTVKSIMTSVREDPELRGASQTMILSALGKRLNINNVTGVDRSDFTFDRTEEGAIRVTVQYQVQEHVAFNVAALLSFEHAEVFSPK